MRFLSDVVGFVSSGLLSKVQPPIRERVLRDIPRSRQVPAKVPKKTMEPLLEDGILDVMSVLSSAALERFPLHFFMSACVAKR